MTTQEAKALRFQELHRRPGLFVIPNPFDGSSAKLLAHYGAEALATSSGAAAGHWGQADGRISREQALSHAALIAGCSDLPVAADLENGFGDSPEAAAQTIRDGAEAGLVGGSIEDAPRDKPGVLYDLELATARVAAAAQAARALPFPFTFTARCESFARGLNDLNDVIARLNRYADAGADVLFAPGLPDLDAVAKVCAAVPRPVNFMAGVPGRSFPLAALEAAGVKRVSLAGSLYRAALTGMAAAFREVRETGSFGYVDQGLSAADMKAALSR